MEFYKKLKEERLKHNLSQEELALKLNISRQSISKWELEKGYPNIETLIALSDLFNISIDELIKGDAFLKDKIIKEGKMGELKMTDQFKWLYVVSSILVVFWLFVLPWSNLSGLTLSIINLIAIIYFVIVVHYIKNNKKKFFN
ncbi:TPA: helix-turn-helix domain-containing protein [Bacillus cereus]|uniref:XRE family transcriptional regulator n=1 Tax=Bacillus cereus TaxID=1396 RepID=A0A1D3NJE2_BACCE|nr:MULTISPECIES: helix-turn-helix transcriptional regulator [Bacillus]MCP1179954.1 helix-turn-helix domain-containing protein [Bacillus sp. 1663tsa1]MCP1282200.1 helix-turn-helix domain-containing protein [Bacillus sp. S0635]MCQ6346226.1 helix-turn-helix domain-containing protein [Bacillus cereus]MCU5462372.1 helix-turn-helix domain-containing protein [Bacillus cereus]MCU5751564.1 helix-turn-helix domain-containing protein [Bacillus cereus]